MTLLPTNTFVAGDLWSWSVSSLDYPANIYTLRYIFRHRTDKTAHVTVSSTQDDQVPTDHVLSLAGSSTAALLAGEYLIYVQAIEKASSNVQTVEQGTCIVQADPMNFSVSSKWQTAIETLEASLIADASSAVLEYEILGRKIKRMSIKERKEALDYCKRQLRIEQGKAGGIKTIQFLFHEY